MKRILILGVFLGLACAPVALGAYGPGDSIANFTLTDDQGVTRSLHDYTGDIIVLNWWTPS